MRSDPLFGLVPFALVGALVLGAACGGDDNKGNPGGTGGSGTGVATGGSGGGPEATPISAKATVKLKTGERLVNDLAQALALAPDELCNELGTFDCGSVHAIALGGVDAYGAGVFEPLKASAVTTPIAVDRLVLSACQTRAYRDLVSETDKAVLFGDLNVTGGTLDPQSDEVAAVVTELFHRGHLREPKAAEIDHLRQLYVDIEATGAESPARDWATLSCYAVFTMLESVFY